MYDVVLFGGTDEGHKIADFLKDNGINYVVCVATEYGSEVIENENVIVGRMDDKEMSDFFIKNSVKLVIDATHPYAQNVTENIKKSCRCKYIRVIRDEKKVQGHHFDSVKSAVSFLKKTEGKILITTGSKEINEFSCIADRCFARVLPCEESIKLCRSAGFNMSNIICMQGPFSKDFNSAIIKEIGAKYLVTKNSGKSGGFDEKVQAAEEFDVELIIIDRPKRETGVTVDECKKLILEIHTEVIELVGADNCVQVEGAGSGAMEISFEQLLNWNPNVLLFGEQSMADGVANDPVWQELTAVQEGNYSKIPSEPYSFLDQPPAANRVIGVKWLGNLLYPEIYDYDMVKEVQEFYSLFYHYDLTEEQAQEILGR